MIFKNIAEYEDADSDLAKFTISQLHSKIDYLQPRIDKAIEETYSDNIKFIDIKVYKNDMSTLRKRNEELREIIDKAIEFIEYNIKHDKVIYEHDINWLLEILKGEDNE